MAPRSWPRVAYSLLMYLLLPALVVRLFVRRPGTGIGLAARLGFTALSPDGSRPVIVHAVSVGEVNAALPLLKGLRDAAPAVPLVLTTTTPTGYEVANRIAGHIATVGWFPFDLPGAMARWLRRTNPRLLILMETELWPNLIATCRRNDIPVVVANARLSERSARGYRWLGGFAREMLRSIRYIGAQSEADAARFVALGVQADRVPVTGNLKFDMAAPMSLEETGHALRQQFGMQRFIWVAGSTREGEEAIVLDSFRQVRDRFPQALLVLAPRHPERAAAVADICRRAGFAVQRRSTTSPENVDAQVYLIDTIGELVGFYAAADIAFVGGSLVRSGGQNLLEPASVGRPVLTGPHTFNFTEVHRKLASAGGLRVVHNAAQLATAVIELLGDGEARNTLGEAGRSVFLQNRGAVVRTLAQLAPLLR